MGILERAEGEKDKWICKRTVQAASPAAHARNRQGNFHSMIGMPGMQSVAEELKYKIRCQDAPLGMMVPWCSETKAEAETAVRARQNGAHH